MHLHHGYIQGVNAIFNLFLSFFSKGDNFFLKIDDNGTLIIKNSNYQRDSGAYKCYASNVAGNSEDIAMLYIQKPNQTENCKTLFH